MFAVARVVADQYIVLYSVRRDVLAVAGQAFEYAAVIKGDRFPGVDAVAVRAFPSVVIRVQLRRLQVLTLSLVGDHAVAVHFRDVLLVHFRLVAAAALAVCAGVFSALVAGHAVVVGHAGVRVTPPELGRKPEDFEFMTSEVSTEKPKGVLVRLLARMLRDERAALMSRIRTLLDDQADIYGGYTAEAILGGALRAAPSLRGQMEIITKCDIVAPVGRHAAARGQAPRPREGGR